MTDEKIRDSIKKGSLQLTFWQKLQHFSIVLFIFLISGMFIFLGLKEGSHWSPFEIGMVIVPSIIAIFFYYLQTKRLKLTPIETNLNRKEIGEIIADLGTEQKWHPFLIDENIIIAKTDPSLFSGSWGEQVTILIDNNKILVNSICDPDKQSSVVSMGRNMKNVKLLIAAFK